MFPLELLDNVCDLSLTWRVRVVVSGAVVVWRAQSGPGVKDVATEVVVVTAVDEDGAARGVDGDPADPHRRSRQVERRQDHGEQELAALKLELEKDLSTEALERL